MKAFKLKVICPNSTPSYRTLSGWSKDPEAAKVYTKKGSVKNAAGNTKNVVIELLEIEHIADIPIANFREEF